MHYLEAWEVEHLNERTIAISGGTLGSVNEANLQFVCDKARLLGKSPTRVAAHYFYWFAFKAHAFTDGNKRTALDSMMAFLDVNGLAIQTNNEEMVGLALTTAKGEMSVKEVESWIKARLIRLDRSK